MAEPSPENGRPATTPPPPAANLQPRTARSALILAGFLATVVAGWYVWGDAISDKLAGVGHGGGHREAKETAVVPRSATLNRSALPSPPSDTQRHPWKRSRNRLHYRIKTSLSTLRRVRWSRNRRVVIRVAAAAPG